MIKNKKNSDIQSESKQELEMLKEDFAKSCNLLYHSGLVSGVGGNLSMRSGREVLITPSGFSLRDIKVDNIVMVNMKADVISEGIPSKDVEAHLAILRIRAEINVVCHVHGVDIIAASTLMVPGRKSIPPVTPGYVYFAHPLKMIPFFVPGSPDLIKAVERHFSSIKEKALLLQNHGLITIGKNFGEALNITEEINEAAKIWLATKGSANVIKPHDIRKIKEL